MFKDLSQQLKILLSQFARRLSYIHGYIAFAGVSVRTLPSKNTTRLPFESSIYILIKFCQTWKVSKRTKHGQMLIFLWQLKSTAILFVHCWTLSPVFIRRHSVEVMLHSWGETGMCRSIDHRLAKWATKKTTSRRCQKMPEDAKCTLQRDGYVDARLHISWYCT